MIAFLKQRFLQSEFARNVLTLATGTTLAQFILFAFSPVLTRLYSPEEFGVFGVFATVASILAVVACLSFESAIVLPKEEKKAINLMTISFLSTLLMFCLALIIFVFFGDSFAALLNLNEIKNYIWVLPLVVLLTGFSQTLVYVNIREERFKKISVGRVAESSANVAFSVALGAKGFGAIGMIIGLLCGYSSLLYSLCFGRFTELAKKIKDSFELNSLKNLIKEYKTFPTYYSLSNLTDVFAMKLYIIMFMYYFGTGVVGMAVLVVRVLQTPVHVIGSSVSRVFYQKISKIDDHSEILRLYLKLCSKLILFSIFMTSVVLMLPNNTMGFVFGSKWLGAMLYLKIAVIWTAVEFVGSTLSIIFVRMHKQKVFFFLNLFHVALVFSSISYGQMIFSEAYQVFFLFCLAEAFNYLLFILVPILLMKKAIKEGK